MINWNLYDDIEKINQNWIDSKYKRFYSRTIPYKLFYTLLKKYDNVKNETNYYLILSDEQVNTYRWHGVAKKKDYIKVDLSYYWNELPIYKLKGVTEVNIEVVEQADNACIYYIDI